MAGADPLPDRPPARRRLPVHLQVCQYSRPRCAPRHVVAAASLTASQRNALEAACSSKAGPYLRAKRVSSDAFVASSSKDAVDVVPADRVAEICFPVTPELVAYRVKGREQHYFSVDAMASALDVDAGEIVDALAYLHPDDAVTGSVEGVQPTYDLQPRSPPFPHLQDFVSTSVAVAFYPEHRDRFVGAASIGDMHSPRVPEYTIAGTKHGVKWISTLDLRVAADAAAFELDDDVSDAEDGGSDDEDSFAHKVRALGPKNGSHMCNAVRIGDGTLQRCVVAKRGSGAFVDAAWIRVHIPKLWAKIRCDVSPAIPGAPILMDTNAVKVRVRCIPKGARISTYSMTLRRRLKDVDTTLKPIMETVSAVRRGVEYGSVLLTLHALRLLDNGEGTLPDTFDLRTLAAKAMVAVRRSIPQHPELADTFRQYRAVLEGYVDTSLAEVGNSMKYAIGEYVTNTYTSVGEHGPARIKALLAAVHRLYDGHRFGNTVLRCSDFVEGRGTLPDDISSELAACANKYREIYLLKGLQKLPGFDIHSLPKKLQAERHRRCLELFWQINRDLRAVRDTAIASGRWRLPKSEIETSDCNGSPPPVCDPEDPTKDCESHIVKVWKSGEFAPLPIASVGDRFAMLDSDVLRRKVFREAANASESFVAGDVHSLFKLDGAARSIASGWKRSAMFRTDGTTLQEIWFHPASGDTSTPPPESVTREKKRKAAPRAAKSGYEPVDIPEDARCVGDDPGVVNEHFVCEQRSNGRCTFTKLDRKSREDALRDLKLRREQRVKQHASAALEALSGTRRRTFDSAQFVRYTEVRSIHRKALERAYVCRAARSEAFSSRRILTSRLDGFINRVIDGGEDGRAARLKGRLYWGEGNATASAQLSKRLKTAHRQWVQHVWVDEFGTSKFDCITHEELAPAYRRGIGRGGQAGWIKDRDVRFRTTEFALESRHPCPYPITLLLNKGFRDSELQKWVAVDRDGNASYAIRKLMGLQEEARPQCYRRVRGT